MKMHNENSHPVLTEPPLAHALHHWNEEERVLSYEYNGVDVFTLQFSGSDDPGFRHGSDGNINSGPFVQQLYAMFDSCTEPLKARFRIRLKSSALPMKPHRSEGGTAIRGGDSRALLYGINGFYDRDWDFLISWHGVPWGWSGERAEVRDGFLTAEGWMEIGRKPLFVNLHMHYYRSHLGFRYHKPWEWKPDGKALAGWCSWEAYRRDVSQDHLEQLIPFLKEQFGEYGLEYMQIDDGFQKMPIPPEAGRVIADSWLATNEQFPLGHRRIIESIGENGFTPAIWTNVNVTNRDFGEEGKDALIWDGEGVPLEGEWIDFLMNCEEGMLEKHVDPYYRGLYKLGYRYFKTDAIRHLLMDGLHEAVRLGLLSNEEAGIKFRRFIEHARREIGDSVFLSSWGVMEEVVGAADACRVAMDANPTWAGMRMQIVETARWFHTQRILFTVDPDHLCARGQEEWVRSVSSLISLSGGVYMLSDPLEAYDGERVDIIRKTLPPCRTVTAETGPLKMDFPAFTWTKLHGFAVPREEPVKPEAISDDEALHMAGDYPGMYLSHPFGSLWSFSFSRPGLVWDVILRTAVIPLEESALDHSSCGLDPGATYYVYDFWNRRYCGVWEKGSDSFPVPPLELGHCQVLAFHRADGRVRYLGDDRHVSCGMQTVESVDWGEGGMNLSYRGIAGTVLVLTFHRGGRKIIGVSSSNSLRFDLNGDIMTVEIDMERKEDILKIQWE